MSILSVIVALGSVAQIAAITHDSQIFYLIQKGAYSPILWITMPLRWMDAIPNLGFELGRNFGGAVLVILLAAVVGRLCFVKPHRDLKIAMIFFASMVLYTGMFKFRRNLNFFATTDMCMLVLFF